MMALDGEGVRVGAKVLATSSAEHPPSRFQETKEFLLLRPFCNAVVQEPSEHNFRRLQEALEMVITMVASSSDESKASPPPHLVEYVVFPFVLHLKMIVKYK
jgi:hypothetical protein